VICQQKTNLWLLAEAAKPDVWTHNCPRITAGNRVGIRHTAIEYYCTRCDLIKRGVLASLPPLPRKALAALRANRALSQKATLARLLCAWPPTKTKSQNPTEDALPASLPACLPVPFLRIQNTAKG
jgi:hypothetical protein